ncbi:hypothetical protein QJS10_CPA01g02717 [Acorus calamus]|uniref:Exostosin GT47 domain-containing protein n=1 Tax=Acorus calamus TaxID=4465 RepID=A0AAV9FTW1_ACOCL|nr:hypothetical protein QJS10_CPA01g02717 [Acorus calamus]
MKPHHLLLFLLLPLLQIQSQPSDPCSGRRIHIRSLPPRFNTDLLLNCSVYTPFTGDLCPFITNHGLGPKTHTRSKSWFRTDPHLLELLFHHRLLEYPCLSSPSAADAVFLPYYAALDSLRYLYGPDINSSSSHGLHLFDHLTHNDPHHLWSRNSGHDHFLVMARPAWDFSQSPDADPPVWGTSFLTVPVFFNVTALTFESRPWPWQEHAVPYPTSFHPATVVRLESWIARVRRSRRTSLMMFAGGGGSIGAVNSPPNVRRSIRVECENGSGTAWEGYARVCEFVDCSDGVCEHDPIRFMKPMLRASFCLQPPGDTPTRKSTFDSIIAGCIPVFFEEASAKAQFGWHLPEMDFEEFSVLVPKEEVVANGLSITEVLMGIPEERVRRMRERLIEMVPRVIYRRHGSSAELRESKDAFDLAVEGVLGKIKERLRGLREEGEASVV